MSRVGKMPIALPSGVDVNASADLITVKGSLGTLTAPANALVTVNKQDGQLTFTPAEWNAFIDGARSGAFDRA